MQPDSQQEPQSTIIQGLSTWKGNGGEPQCPLALACCHMYTHGQAAQTHLAPNWACRKYTQDLFHTAHGDFRGGEVGPSMREHISNNSIVFISSGLPVSPVSIATTTKKTKAELTIQLLAQP